MFAPPLLLVTMGLVTIALPVASQLKDNCIEKDEDRRIPLNYKTCHRFEKLNETTSPRIEDLPKSTKCGPGFYAQCLPCPLGYSKNSKQNTPCDLCGPGSGTPDEGAERCTQLCEAGSRLKTVGKKRKRKCTECEIGFYQPYSNVDYHCVPCPHNMTTAMKGRTSIKDCFLNCPPGQHPNSDFTACVLCPEGTYKPDAGLGMCSNCTKNKTTAEPGAIDRKQCKKLCEAGSRLKEDEQKRNRKCTECEIGFYQPYSNVDYNCVSCPHNMTTAKKGCTSIEDCVLKCPPGQHPNSDFTACVLCPEGTYKPDAGLGMCSNCTKNKTTAEDGAIDSKQCTKPCGPGKEHNKTSGDCDIKCGRGTFKGEVSSRTRCRPCPQNFAPNNRKAATACIPYCGPGYEINDNKDNCTACGFGFFKMKTGNFLCQPCPESQMTLAKATKDSGECQDFHDCAKPLSQKLELLFSELQGLFEGSESFIDLMVDTCRLGSTDILVELLEEVVNSFQTCGVLGQINLSNIEIGGKTYAKEHYLEIFRTAYGNGGMCNFVLCLIVAAPEIRLSKSWMTDNNSCPATESHCFCSDTYRALAISFYHYLQLCPAVQFHPEFLEVNIGGTEMIDSLLAAPNVLTFCALANSCDGVDCGYGTCSCSVSGGYKCQCRFGYTGQYCETAQASTEETEPDRAIKGSSATPALPTSTTDAAITDPTGQPEVTTCEPCQECPKSPEPPKCPIITPCKECPEFPDPPMCPTNAPCPDCSIPVCPSSEPCPDCPKPPEPPICPTSLPCPECPKPQEPRCPTELPCQECPTLALLTSAPCLECPKLPEEPTCPTREPCPTCPTPPKPPACPTSTPCPNCPTLSDLPAIPTSTPCPVCPEHPATTSLTCATCPDCPKPAVPKPCPTTKPCSECPKQPEPLTCPTCPSCNTCPSPTEPPPCPTCMSCPEPTPCPTGAENQRSCLELLKQGYTQSGVYKIFVQSLGKQIEVYCDQDTNGGGWIVLQRRQNGSVDFYRDWNDYRDGFGQLTREFWLGLDNINQLTTSMNQELRIDLKSFNYEARFSEYSTIKIGSESSNYALSLDGYTGNTGDSLGGHNGQPFSTKDADHDSYEKSCAQLYKGGWWYNSCHSSNLNGLYLNGEHESYADGVEWYHWKGHYYSLKFTEMKVRELQNWNGTRKPKSCLEWLEQGHSRSGVYQIYVETMGRNVEVYCDQTTDGGGWIVFQRRKDGSMDFYRGWNSYQFGFGQLEGEFWLGLDTLHHLTTSKNCDLRINFQSFDYEDRLAKYNTFAIGSESSNYVLTSNGYTGNAGDSLGGHNGQPFSTKDADHDAYEKSCAQVYKGGWWYNSCHSSNLNGLYLNGEHESYADGIDWYHWKGHHYSLKFTEMKFREWHEWTGTRKPKSCLEWLQQGHSQSGIYQIYVAGMDRDVEVYCDQDTDGGGWIVFQRRKDGSIDFYRGWNSYEFGFGQLEGEFWLGLEVLHHFTTSENCDLRIDFQSSDYEDRLAKYSTFAIGSESSNYALTSDGYTGNAGNSLGGHNGQPFSTKDADHDAYEKSCAQLYKGGWWYNSCHSSNLNGLYLNGEHESYADGIDWYHWRGHHYSLKFTEMKVREWHEWTASRKPKSCLEWLKEGHSKSGIYQVYVAGMDKNVEVYCDQDTDGGGWIVFQRRQDGSIDFYRGWNSYQFGFGQRQGEFWLGLESLHHLTTSESSELRIDLQDTAGEKRYAQYSTFVVGSDSGHYVLTSDGYTGNAGDSLGGHNGQPFSTKDADHDAYEKSCAEIYKGGWWYNSCHSSNLNGLYLNGKHESYADGIEWYHWKGHHYSLKFTEMKVREIPDY